MTGGREPPLPNIEKSIRREFADKLGDDTEKFLHNWDKWYTSSPPGLKVAEILNRNLKQGLVTIFLLHVAVHNVKNLWLV